MPTPEPESEQFIVHASTMAILKPVLAVIDDATEALVKGKIDHLVRRSRDLGLTCEEVLTTLGEINGIRTAGARMKALTRAANTPKE